MPHKYTSKMRKAAGSAVSSAAGRLGGARRQAQEKRASRVAAGRVQRSTRITAARAGATRKRNARAGAIRKKPMMGTARKKRGR